MAWTAPRTWVTGETLTATLLNTHLRDQLLYFEAGADVASAASVQLDNETQGITGATTIDSITTSGSLVAGLKRYLWIKGGPLTIRNNGGLTGNIRTLTGKDMTALANEVVTFVYDGTVWRVQGLRIRIVRGQVSSAGGVASGSGFTAVRNLIGDYTVTYSTAFANTPQVFFSQDGSNVTAKRASSSATAFTVHFYAASTGADADQTFDFMAVEVS